MAGHEFVTGVAERAGGKVLKMAKDASSRALPSRAMVLAAGRGERLRPLTDSLPKPLVPIAGRTLLDRILDRLAAAGVEEAVVNLHHLGAQIRTQLASRCDLNITFSEETEALETGGGLARALAHFQGRNFFAINGDVLWQDFETPALARLAAAWDDAKMDGLLLLQPVAHAVGYDGSGDFEMSADGGLERRSGPSAPFVFTGVQILHPRLFDAAPEGRFSLNLLYDQALLKGRLFGLAHKGTWFHVGTLPGLAIVEENFQENPS